MKNIIAKLTIFLSLLLTLNVLGCTKVESTELNKVASKKVETKVETKKDTKKVKKGQMGLIHKNTKITAKVLFKTNKGEMLIGLYGEATPITVKNFLQYVKDGFYKGLLFHRVIPGFVIQGGGMEPGMIKKVNRNPIKLEIAKGLKHTRGVLSMARTQVEDSGTSQFFICLGDASSLNNKYAVFGELLEGFKVLDTIAATPTGRKGHHSNVPKEDIIILDATIIK